jgi:alkyldihydroxyacetonephosphate synthase
MIHWKEIKECVSQLLIDLGATITHHHAVGKDHLSFYYQQEDKLWFVSVLLLVVLVVLLSFPF